jgi:hypothetical protein
MNLRKTGSKVSHSFLSAWRAMQNAHENEFFKRTDRVRFARIEH